ncbi:hypothetical protein L2E82_30175 [Cichorium intybus]|uniref:Uncharacterized protein n=1 Tax=Cichorium intybus TaxID=13427 RepID=A0ACB9CZL6_CICIN|nr:hypothetical protein L2E82_30175 [Cichorium intybus]
MRKCRFNPESYSQSGRCAPSTVVILSTAFVDFLSLLAEGEKDNEDHNLWFLMLLVWFRPSLLLLYSNSFGNTHCFEFRPTEVDRDDAPDDGISLSSSTLCFSLASSCS